MTYFEYREILENRMTEANKQARLDDEDTLIELKNVEFMLNVALNDMVSDDVSAKFVIDADVSLGAKSLIIQPLELDTFSQVDTIEFVIKGWLVRVVKDSARIRCVNWNTNYLQEFASEIIEYIETFNEVEEV